MIFTDPSITPLPSMFIASLHTALYRFLMCFREMTSSSFVVIQTQEGNMFFFTSEFETLGGVKQATVGFLSSLSEKGNTEVRLHYLSV